MRRLMASFFARRTIVLDHGADGEVLEVHDLLVPRSGRSPSRKRVLLIRAVHLVDGRSIIACTRLGRVAAREVRTSSLVEREVGAQVAAEDLGRRLASLGARS
jgi:hypothetical protein